MNETYLMLFSIGPVQSFIASARRTQDLYVGSRILSIIARAGVEHVLRQGAELLFPAYYDGQLPQSIPHRFACITQGHPEVFASGVETAMRQQWLTMATQVQNWLLQKVGGGDWPRIFETQATKWLEIYWVAVPYTEEQHGACYLSASQALAARKQTRYFPAVYEPGQKCTLTGAQSALPLDWAKFKQALQDPKDIRLRPAERLGTLAMIKRFIQEVPHNPLGGDLTRFPDVTTIAGGTENDEDPHYLAVLHLDGDNMGKYLGTLSSLSTHRDFSEKLAEFADRKVPEILDKYSQALQQEMKLERKPNLLVYAGGDDVLALLPLRYALPCALDLRNAFSEIMQGELHVSAGISITPHNLPLDGALDEARQAEHVAKEVYGRDAIVVRESHRSGQIREAGGNWEIVESITILQELFAQDIVSGKLGYDWLQLAHDLDGEMVSPQARKMEAQRILRRRVKVGMDPSPILDHLPILAHFAEENSGRWQSLAHWIILARFLAKEGL